MPTIHTKVEPDIESTVRLSQDHPNTTFQLTGEHTPDTDAFYVLLEAPKLPAETVLFYLESDLDVDECEIIYTDERTTLTRFRVPPPTPYRAGRMLRGFPQSTLSLRDGWIHAETTTTLDRVQEYVSVLRESGVDHEIVSFSQSTANETLLTDRQREVVESAVKHGYYETPRACTLADLAVSLDVHTSTVGDVLNRAEGRIITEFVQL